MALPSARATEPQTTPGPVLVVEDDEDIRETVADVLQRTGRAVWLAPNGAEALDLLRAPGAERPSLILLDLMMPVMDGWQFHAEINKDAALAAIPIVVLSGDARVAEKAQELGCAAAVGKPVSLSTLLELVNRYG